MTYLVSSSRDRGESEAKTSSHFCKKWHSDPELPFSAVHNFLRTEGIRLTLTGHQHVGDAKSVTSFVFFPLTNLFQTPHPGVQILELYNCEDELAFDVKHTQAPMHVEAKRVPEFRPVECV